MSSVAFYPAYVPVADYDESLQDAVPAGERVLVIMENNLGREAIHSLADSISDAWEGCRKLAEQEAQLRESWAHYTTLDVVDPACRRSQAAWVA